MFVTDSEGTYTANYSYEFNTDGYVIGRKQQQTNINTSNNQTVLNYRFNYTCD